VTSLSAESTRRLAGRTSAVLIALGLSCSFAKIEGGAQVAAASGYENGLTPNEREIFYHLPEGSELFPYDFLQALHAPDGKPFMANLDRFGLINDSSNELGLPVGLTIDQVVEQPVRFTGNRVVGVNCAACHTGELEYRGERVRVDGAPGMFNLQLFYEELFASFKRTLHDPIELRAFIRRLKDWRSNHPQDRPKKSLSIADQLRYVEARIQFLKNLKNAKQHLTPNFGKETSYPGFGRVDAFGTARALVFPKYARVLNAPVSYPHLWGFENVEWLHWDANTNSVVERNIGQALGLGAIVQPKHIGMKSHSTIKPKNLFLLEDLAAKIAPPVWPSAFGAIDSPKAERGAVLYQQHCASCHSSQSQYSGIDEKLFRPSQVGTDPNRAENFGVAIGKESFSSAIADVLKTIKEQSYSDAGIDLSSQDRAESGRASAWRVTGRYVSRPLRAAWATAPYLHNNSVPTMYELLLPVSKRSSTFSMGFNEYDPIHLGFVQKPADVGHTFDTSLPGNSNSGHEYGAQISDGDRYALLEYLKTF
jgi:mono/diheme cytochrome c family protein